MGKMQRCIYFSQKTTAFLMSLSLMISRQIMMIWRGGACTTASGGIAEDQQKDYFVSISYEEVAQQATKLFPSFYYYRFAG